MGLAVSSYHAMSHTRFRMNPDFIVVWMSRNLTLWTRAAVTSGFNS